jgi:putative acetyltransferase
MRIAIDDLTSHQVVDLLNEHLEHMNDLSPRESVHALDPEGLKHPDITFWAAWDADQLMGCAALRELSTDHGEVKSMRTSAAYLRRGVAANLLQHLLSEARDRDYHRVSLETGSQPGFEPARQLYFRHGFEECPPFEGYKADPNSFFMTRLIQAN